MIDLSFVFPCLNEEKTIPLVVRELQNVLKKMPIKAEIIISDNGSTDQSVAVAKKLGCRVVYAKKKGYGEALKKGFAEASGKYIAFADIDGSYPLNYLPKMYQKIVKEDLDMVIAGRLKGKIEKGAMPFLHRYLGTPILTGIINILFAGKLSDCNSGFRIFKRKAYLKWDVHAAGMEFAGALLIKSLKNKAKIAEIPAGLRVDKRDRPPHLRTWRDGMRNILCILSESPKFFETVGCFAVIGSGLSEIMSMIFGPLKFGEVIFFDYHSKLILLGIMIFGMYSYLFSACLYTLKPKENPFKITRQLLTLSEETLLAVCISCVVFLIVGLGAFFSFWAFNSFHGIAVIRPLIDIVYWLIFVLIFAFGLLQVHLFKVEKKKLSDKQ